jgi:hypothetical protein
MSDSIVNDESIPEASPVVAAPKKAKGLRKKAEAPVAAAKSLPMAGEPLMAYEKEAEPMTSAEQIGRWGGEDMVVKFVKKAKKQLAAAAELKEKYEALVAKEEELRAKRNEASKKSKAKMAAAAKEKKLALEARVATLETKVGVAKGGAGGGSGASSVAPEEEEEEESEAELNSDEDA